MNKEKIAVLVNPKAGRGKASRRLAEVEKLIRQRGLSAEIFKTGHPGHAQVLARQIRDDNFAKLVIIGGDGTISDVVNVLADTSLPIGIIPAGTGNDVARSLGIVPGYPEQALSNIVKGDTIGFDVGHEKISGRRFVSFAGCGFPALVAEEANRMRLLKGRSVFFVSLYKVVRKLKGLPIVLTVDGSREELIATSIMIQNTPYTGGGLKVAPGAEVDDGYFDVVVVSEIGIMELMRNFPKLYTGTHLNHPAFRLIRGKKISIEMPGNELISFDGETANAERLEIEVKPGAVRLIV